MPVTFRLATFNVENLFERAKVLNLASNEDMEAKLRQIADLQGLLRQEPYDRAAIWQAYRALSNYIDIRENRGKLFRRRGNANVGIAASGPGDWDGETYFKRAKFSETQRQNTATVVKAVKADVLCLVEAESLEVMRAFNTDLLNSRYKVHLLIDAFDPRGIDLGLYSREWKPLELKTHMFDRAGAQRLFSRDCLEVALALPDGTPLFLLLNHFKSKHGGDTPENKEKRRRQAAKVAELVARFDLGTQLVAVLGDLNDTPDSAPLGSLLTAPGLHDVLARQFSNPQDRWTYHYRNEFNQIDYILASTALMDRFRNAGVERRGIADLDRLTDGAESSFTGVTSWRDAASDHAAVWAEFSLP